MFNELILIVVTLLFLAIASYTDFKKREVPDWISYGLIFSGLGLRSIFSITMGWEIIANGVLGFLLCFGLAYLFYYTNQWGGGDSKLLMGMGAVIGLGINFQNLTTFDFKLFFFFIGLLLIGAIFGLIWCGVLAIRKKEQFITEFSGLIYNIKRLHLAIAIISILFLGVTLFYSFMFWPLIILPIGSFYLLCFVKSVENSCFIKNISVKDLVEGDWLAEDLKINKKHIAYKHKALEKKQINKILKFHRQGKIKEILVREGIPFVPVFFLSYLILTLFF